MVVWLSMLSLVAGLVAPASAEVEPSYEELPSDAIVPLEGPFPAHLRAPKGPVPPDGATPLEGPLPTHPEPPGAVLPPDGATPLEDAVPTSDAPPSFDVPLGMGPAPEPAKELDPPRERIVRLDVLMGPVWRIRPVDAMVSTSAEFGRMHGLSAAFHTEFLVVTQRGSVRGLDVPLGVGVIARGRLRKRPLYGSVGLTAGILVHRAAIGEERVIHRVDPDFRLPIRLAWTMAGFGASVAVVTGYSVRERVYERRGSVLLNRHSVRIGLLFGLHWDLAAGRAQARRYGRRQDGGRR